MLLFKTEFEAIDARTGYYFQLRKDGDAYEYRERRKNRWSQWKLIPEVTKEILQKCGFNQYEIDRIQYELPKLISYMAYET